MSSNLKFFLKRFWIVILLALIINVPLIVIGTTRTNTYLNLKGDTTPFTSVVDVESDYAEAGSFSTIYVISFNHSTILQNWLTKDDPTIYQGEISTSTSTGSSHISDIENYKAGKIQYKSSIYNSIILAYKEAIKLGENVHIDYAFDGYHITWYNQASEFRIGDKIVGVTASVNNGNYVDYTDEALYRSTLSSLKEGDTFTVLRDGKTIEIEANNDNKCSVYGLYEIDMDTIFPKLTIKENMIGGPSGGLLQTLSIFNRITESDLTHGKKIAGTGTISINGSVGAIGAISQKVPTAIDDNIDIFFAPEANYEEALTAFNSIKDTKGMQLVKVSTFSEAVSYLRGIE